MSTFIKPEDLAAARSRTGAQERFEKIVGEYNKWGESLSGLSSPSEIEKALSKSYGYADYFKHLGNTEAVKAIESQRSYIKNKLTYDGYNSWVNSVNQLSASNPNEIRAKDYYALASEGRKLLNKLYGVESTEFTSQLREAIKGLEEEGKNVQGIYEEAMYNIRDKYFNPNTNSFNMTEEELNKLLASEMAKIRTDRGMSFADSTESAKKRQQNLQLLKFTAYDANRISNIKPFTVEGMQKLKSLNMTPIRLAKEKMYGRGVGAPADSSGYFTQLKALTEKYENILKTMSKTPHMVNTAQKTAEISGQEINKFNGLDATRHDVINGKTEAKGAYEIYSYMQEGEKYIYNLLASSENPSEATEYIEYLNPFLEERAAQDLAQKMDEAPAVIGGFAEFGAIVGHSIQSALENIALAPARVGAALGSNYGDAINRAIFKSSESQLIKNAILESEDSKVWKFILQTTGTIAEQAPALALGAVTGGIGYKFALTSNIVSSSIQEAAQNGSNLTAGLVYGLVSAALELTIEKITDGVGAKYLGGKTGKFFKNTLSVIDDVIKRPGLNAATKWLVSRVKGGIGEGLEEAISGLVDPALRNIILGESNKYDEETLNGVLEQAIVGFLSGFVLSGGKKKQAEVEARSEAIGKELDPAKTLRLANDVGLPENSPAMKEIAKYTGAFSDIDPRIIGQLSQEIVSFTYGDGSFMPSMLNFIAKNGSEQKVADLLLDGDVEAARKLRKFASDVEYEKFLRKGGQTLTPTGGVEAITESGKTIFRRKGERLFEDGASTNLDENVSMYLDGKMSDSVKTTSETPNATLPNTINVRDIASARTVGVLEEVAPILNRLTAANPKADVMKDAIARSSGVQRLSDGQKKLREIGQSFGAKVIFDDLDYTVTDKYGNQRLVSPEGEYDRNTNTITLNTNVKDYHRPVQFILKHELTHSLEKAGVDYEQFMGMVELSNEFEEYLKKRIEAAKSSQEFKEFEQTFANENDLEALSDFDLMIQYTIYRYNENGKPLGSENETAETAAKKELTADFVADVLFNGDDVSLENLLKSLQPETRNKFIEAVKNIIAKLKEIFVGTSELTEIEQLEQKFLEVANKVKEMNAAEAEQQKATGDGSGVKHSIVTLDSGKSYVQASRRVITSKTVAEQRKEITDFFNEALKNGPIEIKTVEGDVLTISKETANKARSNATTENGVTRKLSDEEFLVRLHAEAHIDELAEISTKIKKPVAPDTKNHAFAKDGFTYRTVYFEDFDGSYYKITLSVGENNGVSTVYNVGKIKAENIPDGNIVSTIGSKADMSSARQSIPERGTSVNSNSMQSGKKYSYASKKALTANLENLEKAKEREKSSDKEESDSENIRRGLGWFRGLDRIWRYEIDDSKAIFTLPHFRAIKELIGRKGTTLGECLKHDELFAAYPELRDINVEFVSFKELKGALGGYDSATKTISINLEIFDLLNSDLTKEQFDKELLITVIHEVQHAIQDIEGFASGSSEAYWAAIEQEHTEHLKELSRLLSEIRTKGNKELADLACRYVEIKQEIYKYDVQSAEVEAEIQQIEKKAKSKGCYKLLKSFSVEYLICKSYEEKLGAYSSNNERYRNTAGEIEAEDVANRLRMTDEQRENERPDIDRKNVLFVEGRFRKSGEGIAAKTSEGDLGGLARSKGYSQKLYHQTGDNFTVFDTEHQDAGKYDPEMPTGTFLKPDDSDIGLSGKKQMELFTKIKNPLEFKDRADAQRFWMRNIEGYAEALRTIDRINERYSREVARAGMEVSEYKKEWRRNNPDADSRDIYNDAEFQRFDEARDRIAREWDDRSNEASLEAKKLIDGYMVESGYDGVVMENDVGSNGKSTKTYIVFDSSQMKSTDTVTYDDNGNEIPLSARFDSSKKDIRYSLPERNVETYSEEQYNNFGWVRANNVLTAAEYSALMSNYTGHKHKNDNFPVTRFGETVLHTSQYPDVLMYVKGNIRSPQITKILKIESSLSNDAKSEIKEAILYSERRHLPQPYKSVEVFYEEEVFTISKARDYASFWEYRAEQERRSSEESDTFGRTEQDRRGSSAEDTRTDRVSYSLPEHPTPLQIGDAYKNGEITQEEYVDRINELWEETGKAEGTIKPGEIVEPPNKRVPTPKSVSDGTKVRQFARTILESGYATPEMEAYLKELILEGDFSYTPTSNEKTLEKARKNIESQGYGNAKDNWQKAITQSSTGADAVATGEALLRLALEHNDAVEAVNIAADLAEFGTRTAQSLQAFSLLKRMGGLGQLVYIQRTVNKLNEDLKKRFKKNTPVVKLDPKLADLLAKAETNGEYDVFYAKIMQDIAVQVPPTFLDKWNAWRYMSMLFNPTTHIRNLTGNGIFLPAVRMKDLVALGMEQLIAEDQRTKVLKVNKEYQQFAENDFEEVKDIITGSGKYNPSDAVSEYRRIFKNKVLENARKLNFDLLEKEDIIFLKAHYRHALGSFLQARKVDIDNISTAQLVKAREYAINEALKATYRDTSKVANMMSQLSKTNRGANIILEGVLPFKKTPINIMKRGLEYSPIGLVKTLSKGLYDLKSEKITVSQFIDGLAAGTVGTGVFLIGALLSSLGVAKGGFDDDEEWFRKLNGEQEYSIEIGGKSYTIDWAAPASIPFFMGVAISEYNADEDADILSMLYDFGMAGFEPIMSLSMLSGIEDVISSVSYAEDGQKLTTLVGSSVKSYFSQALPTIFGKVANVLDDTRRTSYIDKTSNIPEVVQQALDKIASKTPFGSKTRAEYIDAWGETKYTGNFIQRFFQQFVSPGYASTVNVTDVSEEISRLYKVTGEAGVYPSTPKKYVKFREVRKDLSQEEYYDYATFKGQRQADLVDEAIHSKEYKSLTDEQKAEVIKDLYNYASVLAKCQLDYTYDEIAAMVGEDKEGNPILTEEKYDRLDDKARRLLVIEYFTESGSVVKAYKAEKNGGSVVEYFIKKIQKENK